MTVYSEVMEKEHEEQYEYETDLSEVRLYNVRNETRVFQCFFKLFGLTLGLRKVEIEGGVNYFFLSLTE
jgi:hypothetical protein